MRDLTKVESWILFLTLIIPFVIGGAYENIFLVLGLFLSIYWVFSVGKFGTMVLELENSILFKVFNVLFRFNIVTLFLHFLLVKYDPIEILEVNGKIILNTTDITFFVTLIMVTIYSGFIFEKLTADKISYSKVLWTSILFWFFPIGIWVLQPRINKEIGDYLE